MSHYWKAVVGAVIALVGVLLTSYFDGRVDQVTLVEAVGALITAVVTGAGVAEATNTPKENRRR